MEEKLYDEMRQTEDRHWWFVGRRRIVRHLAEHYLPRLRAGGARVCEIGCGTGGNLAEWARDHDAVGVDPSPLATRHAAGRGLDVVAGALPGDLPFPPEHFDLVLMTDVFEHIDDDAAAAGDVAHYVRPGGLLVATVPAYAWLYGPRDVAHHHYRRYVHGEFRRLFEGTAFHIEKVTYYNSLLFPAALVSRLASRWRAAPDSADDLRAPVAPMNRLLAAMFAAERHWLPKASFPFGLSLVGVMRRLESNAERKAA